MIRPSLLLDRTAVLFLGVAAGAMIGFAFARGGDEGGEHVALAPEAAAPIADAPADFAPPPPATPDADPAPAAAEEPANATEAAPAAAVEPAPAEPPAPAVPIHAAGDVVRIGVFGDSFGDGVWSALYRLLPAKDGYEVVKFSQQSTGFTRYRRLNLEEHDDAQIAGRPVDVAVISFGANDAQGVCDAGKCGALMSSYWQQVIGARVERYVAMLRRHGASVYWVGLPAMRDAGFDGDANAMDAFYERLMGRLGVPYIDIRPLTVDADGRYSAYYRDGDGTQKLLRAGDGIHMSMNGYVRVTKGLASRIRAAVTAGKEPAA